MGSGETKARKLRGIQLLILQTIKHARKMLEVPLEAALLCKMVSRKLAWKLRETVENENINTHKKTKYACAVEAHESTRKRLESTLPRNHEDHLRERGFIHRLITIWCTNLFPFLQAMKIPDAKAAADKEWRNLEKIPVWNLD